MSVFTRVLRAGEGKKVRRLAEIIPLINELEPGMEALGDAELRHKTVEFRQRLEQGEELEDLLVEAFAVVREAAWRVLGQRHFDVQLMGGMALHFGWIAEMKTGEGKTLVSTLPVYLNALAGQGVHVVTVNDYLATRDAEWMGRLHKWLGLTVGRVGPDVTDPVVKRAAYAADVTYGTNTELGFDYLRDNMARSRDTMAQRGHVFAIIDEVDSILIDEARTPLIISGPADEAAKLYYQFASIARTLERDVDYEVDEEKRHVVPLEDGIEKVERAVGVENLYDAVATNYVHQLTKALEAKELYHRDKEYLVDQGEVKIVDEFTGRTLEGRRWSDGLHQAVEAKERVRIKEENHTWATVTLQNFFRLYEKLGGMTGTAETEAGEFASTYNLPVVPIPTNKPLVRQDEPDLIFKTEEAKFNAVADDIAERRRTGQPVLVGTASVAKSELLSRLLEKQGIPHQVLNAKQHFREAEVVAQAGRLGGVTVATNMAGRGVDIILGGNPEMLARHEALAQGLDLETDEGREELDRLSKQYAETCDGEGEKVRELGGLYVLGSERHESRRIDNQLRGRSGRQGDPGESRFYLSLEDDLMRLFATGAMNWVMGRTLPEDVPIEAKMVTKAIERAQNTVEGRNSEIRKEVLKYDEVMNEQRKVIYARRLQVIDGEDLHERTLELLEATVVALVQASCPSDYVEEWDLEGLVKELAQYYPTQFTTEDLAVATNVAHLTESVMADVLDYYEEHSAALPGGEEQARQIEREVMLQVIDQRWRDHLAEMDYLREGINLRAMGQQDPLVAWQREGYTMFGQLMDAIDDDYLRYVLHVEAITEPASEPDLAQAVYEAADDPVTGTLALAGQLLSDQGVEVAATERTRAPVPAGAVAGGAAGAVAGGAAGAVAGGAAGAVVGGAAGAGGRKGRRPPVAAADDTLVPVVKAPQEKVGRNDPCWCGSGKKYKLCHGSPCEGPAGSGHRDLAAELTGLADRLAAAEGYLRMDERRVRLSELEAEAARPGLWDDADRARAMTTELGRLTDDVQRFDALLADLGDAQVLRELVEEAAAAGDPEEGSAKELEASVDDLDRRLGRLEMQSLFSGDYDDHDAVCEVHAGAGGTDAQDWAEMLLRMYQRWAERRGFSVEVDEATPGQEAGLLSATFIVHGRFAYGLLAAERGVHRLVRMSPFDSQRRRQTSFASFDAVPFLDDVAGEVEIDEKDLRIDTYRSSGAGGQHVNKTDSAVRLTHLPTGMVVAVQNERSQHQNKAKAMQILGAKLAERARADRRAELDSLSGDRSDNAWGSQIRSYVLAPYQLVKDLRTGVETGNVEAVLDGDLDEFMEAELRRQRGATGT